MKAAPPGHLADTVLRHRLTHGWTQQQLADRCTPTTPTLARSTIAKIEAGVRGDVTLTEAATLAAALEVPVADLVAPPTHTPKGT